MNHETIRQSWDERETFGITRRLGYSRRDCWL